MVLQQLSTVPIWGKDKPGTSIIVKPSWGSKVSVKADKDGLWKVQFDTPKAGGPYSISINGSSEIILNNVLLGEVWLCSGQSNMQMTLQGQLNEPVENSNQTILESDNSLIRVFNVKREFSISPKDDVIGNWQISSPKTSPQFSAVSYYFAKMLQQTLKVPVGIIVSSYGGSSIEAWSDSKILSEVPEIEIPKTLPEFGEGKKYSYAQQIPTVLYNSMLHPLIPYKIKGIVWYQGESNCGKAHQYRSLFTSLIKTWREYWNQPDMPFYFAQIAPFYYWNSTANSAYLREAQLQVMQTVKNTGMAVTLDIGEEKSVHPLKKKEVGDRLSYWALSQTYGLPGITYSGPVYKEFEIVDSNINVFFDYVPFGLSSFGKELTGFQIAGEDKKFYNAKAIITTINRSGIVLPVVVVYSDKVSKPIAVRYGFENYVQGTLFNTAGLPASSFRTDNW
jgi:sialate O-acetylesterase